MRVACAVLLLVSACRKPDPGGEGDQTPAFDAPWQGLSATEKASGACVTDVGADEQGNGWFHTEDDAVFGVEGCWARVSRPTGATQDLVTITIAGRDGLTDWYLLEFDVAVSAMKPGYIATDGTEAAGVLLQSSEGAAAPIAYVVDGYLNVDDAGIADDDDLELTFDDISLAAVTP